MNISKKIPWGIAAWILLGIVVLTLLFYIKSCNDKPETLIVSNPTTLIKEVKVIDTATANQLSRYKIKVSKLNEDLARYKKKEIAHISELNTLEKIHTQELLSIDSGYKADLAKNTWKDYTETVHETIKNCDSMVNNYEKQLQVKDSALSVSQNGYADLKVKFHEAIDVAIKQKQYADNLNKQLNKSNFSKSFFKSATIAAVGYIVFKAITSK